MFDTIVFSGGAHAAIPFIGGIRYLEHVGMVQSVQTVVGTSVGSMFAFMFAIGYDSHDMARWVYTTLPTGTLTSIDPEGLLCFADRMGIDDGSRIVDALRKILSDRGMSNTDPTFMELCKQTGINLAVCVVNVTRARREFFSVDETPDVKVLTAIRMSICIPFLFTPVMHDDCLYVDGGLFDNCPVDFVHEHMVMSNTLALEVSFVNVMNTEVQNIFDYTYLLMRAMLIQANQKSSSSPAGDGVKANGIKVVRVDLTPPWILSAFASFSLATLSFKLTEEDVEKNIMYGYDAMQQCINTDEIVECSRDGNKHDI